MIKTSIEKIASDIGYDIGCSDDIVQSDLINGFCKALNNSIQEANRTMQLCYIAEKLNSTFYKILKELVSFLDLKEDEIKANNLNK